MLAINVLGWRPTCAPSGARPAGPGYDTRRWAHRIRRALPGPDRLVGRDDPRRARDAGRRGFDTSTAARWTVDQARPRSSAERENPAFRGRSCKPAAGSSLRRSVAIVLSCPPPCLRGGCTHRRHPQRRRGVERNRASGILHLNLGSCTHHRRCGDECRRRVPSPSSSTAAGHGLGGGARRVAGSGKAIAARLVTFDSPHQSGAEE